MNELTNFFEAQAKVYEYFGYVEDWVVIPLNDCRAYYWYVDGEGPGTVHYADSEQDLLDQDGDYYVNDIYTQRFLKKWVYRGKDFTMICVDTHIDGNKFLSVFDNSKERKPLA